MTEPVVDLDFSLAGKTAMVTGGASGIGAAIAAAFATKGARVAVVDLDEDAAQRRAAELGSECRGFAGNVADPAAVTAVVDDVVAAFGRIDILVNCAGTAEPAGSSILTVTATQFQELIDAHLGTVFQTCRAAAPVMARQRSGAIVNTGSFAFLGDYGGTGYPAGKGAVNGLTLAIAAELAEHGVRANVVCPGAKTRLSSGPDYEAHITALNRRGLLDDVSMAGALDAAPPEYAAPTYAYLVSDRAADVTGQIFIAAGGFVGRFGRPTPEILAYRDHHACAPWTVAEIAQKVSGQITS